MASISIQLEPLAAQGTSQAGALASGQGNASVAQAAVPEPDTVTLAGQTAESQQTHGDRGQSSETAAFFFGERETFHAANGSMPPQGTATTVPSLPVALTENLPQTEASSAPANPQGQADTLAPLSNNQVGNAPSANNTPATSANSQAPIQELAQLDQTLQEIGINPQSISLFNRMAMLLYANDPAALRLLAQAVTSGAQSLGLTGNNTAGTATAATQAEAASAAQSQTASAPAPTANNGASATGPELDILQAEIRVQAALDPATNQGNTSGASQAAPMQTSSFSIQLEELQTTFAALGVQQAASGAQSAAQIGQALNVTA